jgi:hypothetical protein
VSITGRRLLIDKSTKMRISEWDVSAVKLRHAGPKRN